MSRRYRVTIELTAADDLQAGDSYRKLLHTLEADATWGTRRVSSELLGEAAPQWKRVEVLAHDRGPRR